MSIGRRLCLCAYLTLGSLFSLVFLYLLLSIAVCVYKVYKKKSIKKMYMHQLEEIFLSVGAFRNAFAYDFGGGWFALWHTNVYGKVFALAACFFLSCWISAFVLVSLRVRERIKQRKWNRKINNSAIYCGDVLLCTVGFHCHFHCVSSSAFGRNKRAFDTIVVCTVHILGTGSLCSLGTFFCFNVSSSSFICTKKFLPPGWR